MILHHELMKVNLNNMKVPEISRVIGESLNSLQPDALFVHDLLHGRHDLHGDWRADGRGVAGRLRVHLQIIDELFRTRNVPSC